MNPFKCCLAFFLLVMLSVTTFAQEQDSLKNEEQIQRKNVIRYNLTPSLLGFNSYIAGYERVVLPYQSFSINVGYLAFGKDKEKEHEKIDLTNSKSNSGFSLAVDYRFYLKKENKFKAPHGIYIGPYFASYLLRSSNSIKINNTSLGNPEFDIDTRFAIQNIGFELGYQFLIKNRVTIDLILIGPSVANYRLKMKATGNVNVSDAEVEEALKALRDIFIEEYPWVKNLFDENGIDVKGNTSSWSFGYRYVLQVGFSF